MTRRPLSIVCLFLLLFLFFGDWLGLSLVRENPLSVHLQQWVKEHPDSVIWGEVTSSCDTEFSQTVYLKKTYLIYKSKKFPIKNVKVFLKEKKEVPAGTYLLLSGKLEEVPNPCNPGEFNSRQYYACQHTYYFLKKASIKKRISGKKEFAQFLCDLRKHFEEILGETTGEDAPVFSAMVLGEKGELTEEIRLRYQMAGVIHILAISGLHISLLGMGLYEILKKTGLGIPASGIVALMIMVMYGEMTGGSVSAIRAIFMFLLAIGARILGRIYDMITALSISAMMLLLESPAYLYDAGFLLSFCAVLGVGIVFPAIRKVTGVKSKIGKGIVASVSVQLTTLPLMLWFYGEVSLTGIFMNILVLPTVGAVLISGVLAALLGTVSIVIGTGAAIPGRVILWVYEKISMCVCKLPFSTWTGGKPALYQVLLYYMILLFFIAVSGFWVKKGKQGIFLLALSVFLVILAVWVIGRRNPAHLEITCLDIGQGDAIAVQFPTGEVFVVDGGSSSKKKVGEYQLLPFLKSQGISYIDAIFISHTDEDHINGVRELLGYMDKGLISLKAGNLILPGISGEPEAWVELKELAEKADVHVQAVNSGSVFRIGNGKITVLSPERGATGEDVNEDAIVFLLEYREFQGLFTGDIGEKTEKKLLSKLKDMDFLKVGHHGSRYSSSLSFLEKILPEVSVISCSDSNRYGHPSKDAVERLERVGSQVEYTMKSGAVTVVTDGKNMKVRRFKDSEKGFSSS